MRAAFTPRFENGCFEIGFQAPGQTQLAAQQHFLIRPKELTPAHPSGVRFVNGHHSDRLAETLDFIMNNQDQFTRAADACRHGLVLISPPTGDEQTEAAIWRREVQGTANFVAAGWAGADREGQLSAA